MEPVPFEIKCNIVVDTEDLSNPKRTFQYLKILCMFLRMFYMLLLNSAECYCNNS